MKTRKSGIPSDSMTREFLPVDYSDSYEGEFTSTETITPDDLQIQFWTYMPKWMENLFKLRHILVKPFGLKAGEGNDTSKFEECIRSGGSHEVMSVAAKSENETVLRLNDKHLCAYLSVHIRKKEGDTKIVNVSTLVNFHYWLGYVYFYSIYPFHHIVVRQLIKHTLKRISEGK